MNTQINKPPRVLMWVAAVSVILFSLVGMAAFMGWTSPSRGASGNDTAAASTSTRTAAPVKAKCTNCGQIESVKEISTRGEGTGLGVVGGAVVGGALGNQVGEGRGKDLATVAGLVGGAFAGNEIEKRAKSIKSYSVTVRLDDGSSRVINESNLPTWQPGDRVQIANGTIQSRR